MFGANGPFKTQNGASSQLWIRYKDCVTILHNERGKERHGNYNNGFSEKKNNLGQFGHFCPKMVRPHNFGSVSGIFFILHNERGEEVNENFVSCFSRKNLIRNNLIFLGYFLLFDWAWSKLLQVTVTIGPLNSHDIIRILKQSGHVFSGKRFCDGYFMDIMWHLCMEVNIQQRVEWFCEKASLRYLLRNFIWM